MLTVYVHICSIQINFTIRFATNQYDTSVAIDLRMVMVVDHDAEEALHMYIYSTALMKRRTCMVK